MDGVAELSTTERLDASIPVPPPLPRPAPLKPASRLGASVVGHSQKRTSSCDCTTPTGLWDRMFDEGYRADIVIHTDNDGVIYAHASIIGLASPVIRGLLQKSKKQGRWRSIPIRGVPLDAVRAFIRFLYSSCYERQDMEEFAMQLLMLAHAYMVPPLKRLCEWHLENGMLTLDNVVDVFQLALLCDAPRLGLVAHRMILRNFNEVSESQGWTAMKKSHPNLEKALLDSMIEDGNRWKARNRKLKEKNTYSQLYEAMEALVHICREGCMTIGPRDKDFKPNQAPCRFASCQGLEGLLRHFAGCKIRRLPGGCLRCKRMWQLLELHSRLCADSDQCTVPLCRNFKECIKNQTKKDEMRWKLLVKNLLSTKRIGGSPFFLTAANLSS